jgi:hypothetical protein
MGLAVAYKIARARTLDVLRTEALEARFMKFVERDGTGGCWLWVGAMARRKPYGRFWLEGSMRWAHRVSYAIFIGPVLGRRQVHHRCDNTRCVNPMHLEIVVPSTNRRYQELYKYCPPVGRLDEPSEVPF